MILFVGTMSAQEPRNPSNTSGKTNNNVSKEYYDAKTFTINFPNGEPTKTETPVETAIGTIQMTSYMYEKSYSEVYMVAVSAYPKDKIAGTEGSVLLDGAKSGYLDNLGLTTTTVSRKVNIDGHPGIYFEATNSEGYFTAVADYLVDNTLYQVAILCSDGAPTDKEVSDFIFSFKLKSGSSNSKTNANLYNNDPDFRINFFGKTPDREVSPVDTDLGVINMTTYMIEESSSEVYMVAIADYPKEYMSASDSKSMLNSAKDGYLGGQGFTVSSERNLSIDGHSGIYFEASSNNGYYTAAADYLVENRLYQVVILRTDRAPTQSEIQNYIFSFELK